ncbi:unnamed protein product, partial [Prorocentrum cordatum]
AVAPKCFHAGVCPEQQQEQQQQRPPVVPCHSPQANSSVARGVLDRWPALGQLCTAARAAQRQGAPAAAPAPAGRRPDAGAAAYARKRARRAGRPDAAAGEDGAEMAAEEAHLTAADHGENGAGDCAGEPDSDSGVAQEEFRESAEVPEAPQDEFQEGEEVPEATVDEYPKLSGGETSDDGVADSQPRRREVTRLERDAPLWIRLQGVEPDTMPGELEGLPVEALVLSSAGGSRPFYMGADEALADLAGECIEEVGCGWASRGRRRQHASWGC